MGKSQLTLIKETKNYKRKFHPLPLLLGAFGLLIVMTVLAISDLPKEGLLWCFAGLGIAAVIATQFIPFISGCVLIALVLIFTSLFLFEINVLGLFGCFAVLLSGIFSLKLRKDLLSKWGW